ncbi:MAG TPA: peptidase M13 [Microscillaceae bacterium]|nr:peptidase M13 [Microscillaceae bacterium]
MKHIHKFSIFAFVGFWCWGQVAFAQTLDMSNFDTNVRPQDDFFSFVNGGWVNKTQIPATEGRWGSFNEINERNRTVLKQILEDAAGQARSQAAGSLIQLVGDMYTAGMDSTLIESLGFKPILNELNWIETLATPQDILKNIAHCHLFGIPTAFGFGVSADAKDSRNNAAYLRQGGLTLPDRSYYLEDNARFQKIREQYMAHVVNMLKLIGEDDAETMAQQIFAIEKRLAEISRDRVKLRNPEMNYNKRTIDELQTLMPNFNWSNYFTEIGAAAPAYVIVGQPEFMEEINKMLVDTPVDHWQAYFKWKVVTSAAPHLSSAFVNETFDFFSRTLRGVTAIQPRWKRILALVDGSLGDALGQLFVAKAFPPEAKARMAEMIENIRDAFAERIQNLSWMSDETKAQAMTKLKAFVYKIGYPDVWKDYKGLEITPNDHVANVFKVNRYLRQINIDKMGKPVDRNEWGMTPPTVNAYYSPTMNEIVFPAGILQPPFFDMKNDDALNYGAIGAVIGHEFTHGFDDQGSQFDADGNLKMWWTKDDRAKFDERTAMVVGQFNNYKVLDTMHVNGKLTLGENIADLGGLTIAFEALKKSWNKNPKPGKIDGFTPEQRFFIGWAMGWRSKYRDESMMEMIKTDPHSPPYYRVNGPLSNFTPFFEAFEVKEGDPMRRTKIEIAEIW